MTHPTSTWITHRTPAETDAYPDGDVIIPLSPGATPTSSLYEVFFQHYSLVVPGQPWWSEKASANSSPGAATRAKTS